MIRALALLALVAIPAPAVAQRIAFPDGKGSVGQDRGVTLPITWEGKPALLLVVTEGPPFLSYDSQLPTAMPTPVFSLAAAFFMDTRPCAVQPWISGPTSETCLNVDDHLSLGSFGCLAPDGTLLWTKGGAWPAVPTSAQLAFGGWRNMGNKNFRLDYVMAQTVARRTACPFSTFGPELVAMVLVIEGMGT